MERAVYAGGLFPLNDKASSLIEVTSNAPSSPQEGSHAVVASNGSGPSGETRSPSSSPQKEISRGVVAIYKDYLGRGPTTARTSISDDAAVTTLQDSFTKAERSLVESGEAETVREMRRKFQCAMREDITTLVERVTGRECVAFLSDHDTKTDVAVEMVVFASE